MRCRQQSNQRRRIFAGRVYPGNPGSPRSRVAVDGQQPGRQQRGHGRHLVKLGDKLNQEGDRSGSGWSTRLQQQQLQLVQPFQFGKCLDQQWSVVHLSSVSRPGSLRHSRRSIWQGPACIRSLYDLLLAPVEDRLTQYGQSQLSVSFTSRELVLVLDGEFYLVPFSFPKPQSSNDYLCERFSRIVSPSLTLLRTGQKSASRSNRLLQMGQPRSPSGPLTAVSLSTYSAKPWNSSRPRRRWSSAIPK